MALASLLAPTLFAIGLSDSAQGAHPSTDSTPAQPSIRRFDTLLTLRHGALEGSVSHSELESMAYRGADWFRDEVLRFRTREEALRRRLIVNPGDDLDSAKLLETERILRTEPFLADVRVKDTLLDGGRNGLLVESWDRWSTSGILSASMVGGISTWFVGVRESNLFGMGRMVSATYGRKDGEPNWAFSYLDDAFLTQGMKIEGSALLEEEGHTVALDFGVPVAHRYQTWAWKLYLLDQQYRRDLYLTQEDARAMENTLGVQWKDAALFSVSPDSRYRYGKASITRLWGDGVRLHSTAFFESELDSISNPRTAFAFDRSLLSQARVDPVVQAWLRPVPHRDDRRLGVDLTLKEVGFVRMRNFNNLKWTEDIPVGWSTSVSGAWNILARGEVRDLALLQWSGSWAGLRGDWYGAGSGGWKSFLDADLSPAEGSWTFRADGRWMANRYFHWLAGASSMALTGTPTWNNQTSLGEESGLPGWPTNHLIGRGRFLAKTEFRIIPALEVVTAAPALALFAGTGRISDQADPLGEGPWHSGAGVGLRLGMTRAPQALVNYLSLSHPVGPHADGLGWLVSFGASKSL